MRAYRKLSAGNKHEESLRIVEINHDLFVFCPCFSIFNRKVKVCFNAARHTHTPAIENPQLLFYFWRLCFHAVPRPSPQLGISLQLARFEHLLKTDWKKSWLLRTNGSTSEAIAKMAMENGEHPDFAMALHRKSSLSQSLMKLTWPSSGKTTPACYSHMKIQPSARPDWEIWKTPVAAV